MVAVEGRRTGSWIDLTVFTGGEEAPAALLVGGELADGDVFVGGIEDEVAVAVLGGDDGLEAGVVDAFGNLDGHDHVIADERWRGGIDDAAAVIDGNPGGADADRVEHGDHEGGFIFAVAVAGAEDVFGGVRLEAADADFDADVANLLLHEVGDFGEAGHEVAVAGEGFCGAGDVGAAFTARGGKVRIPIAEAGPERVSLRERVLSEVDGHASGKGFPCGPQRHMLEVDAVNVLSAPSETGSAQLQWDESGVVRPDGFLMPARGQIDFEDASAAWGQSFESPRYLRAR